MFKIDMKRTANKCTTYGHEEFVNLTFVFDDEHIVRCSKQVVGIHVNLEQWMVSMQDDSPRIPVPANIQLESLNILIDYMYHIPYTTTEIDITKIMDAADWLNMETNNIAPMSKIVWGKLVPAQICKHSKMLLNFTSDSKFMKDVFDLGRAILPFAKNIKNIERVIDSVARITCKDELDYCTPN